jgi:hypothetical protein
VCEGAWYVVATRSHRIKTRTESESSAPIESTECSERSSAPSPLPRHLEFDTSTHTSTPTPGIACTSIPAITHILQNLPTVLTSYLIPVAFHSVDPLQRNHLATHLHPARPKESFHGLPDLKGSNSPSSTPFPIPTPKTIPIPIPTSTDTNTETDTDSPSFLPLVPFHLRARVRGEFTGAITDHISAYLWI